MYLADEAWPDLESYFESESLALVPLGSTEQHGPHLPESTDHVIAESLAREAAARSGYLCTPTVNVGISRHHRQFPGTMWVSPDTFRAYVRDLTENLTYHGIDRVVYVNAHGGNVDALREVAKDLHADETCYALEWMWDESIPELVDDLFEHNGPHGGPKETAMLQHLTDLVHDDRLADARDGGVRDIWSAEGTNRHGAATFFDARDNSDNGVFGDQTDATAEKGERLFEAATDQLVRLCDWLAAREPEELLPEPRV
ncbi:creatininase family protein [Halosegnis marinus]|uniref:Creatininase family protein n=1 Tax=Halosegnis marinus TaxID=3034023 RepID=A0ABD5ZRG4_9EURY|nr:creatininase family protein [Halosegnis sp. DT85]